MDLLFPSWAPQITVLKHYSEADPLFTNEALCQLNYGDYARRHLNEDGEFCKVKLPPRFLDNNPANDAGDAAI